LNIEIQKSKVLPMQKLEDKIIEANFRSKNQEIKGTVNKFINETP